MAGSQPDDVDQRFLHLLQPIRDLAKNWDVDIARDLQDYLDQLEHVSVTFDGGETKLNFAQAALLIQGSASVYSKKVEYLYTLVNEVQDQLASKKKAKNAGKNDAGDATQHQNDDDDGMWNFLALDDNREGNNIDLSEDGNAMGVPQTPLVPRTPMVLLNMRENNPSDDPLLSRQGDVLGNRRDFKLNTSVLHALGHLILDYSDLALLEESMARRPCSTPAPPRFGLGEALQADAETSHMAVQTDAVPMEGEAGEGIPLMDHSGDDGMESFGVAAGPPEDLPEQREEQRQQPQRMKPPAPRRSWVNKWDEVLDPYEIIKTKEIPFKKGKTWRMPASLMENDPSKKRKRKGMTATECGIRRLESLPDFIQANFFSHRPKFPSNPMKVVSAPELEDLYWEEFKRRRALRLRRKKIALLEEGREDEVADLQDEDEDEDNAGPPNDDIMEPDETDQRRVEFQLPDDLMLGPMDPLPQCDAPTQLELAMDAAPAITSYEELVRHYVDGYLAGAQEYAQVTELSRRVQEWEDRIVPRLQEEEQRSAFDIHSYGGRVLSHFKEEEKRATSKGIEPTELVPFRHFVERKDTFEVCRSFLATLQLANNYNVEICVDGALEDRVDNFSLKLLSTQRHFEELLDYQAPSLPK